MRVSRENLERSEVLVAEGEEAENSVRTSFGFWPDADDVTRAITVGCAAPLLAAVAAAAAGT